MRTIACTLLLLFACALQSPAAAEGEPDLAAVDAFWNDLRQRADVAALDKLLADDWLLTHSDGRVQNQSEYLAELATRTRVNQAIANEDVRTRRYGDTTIVTGTSVQSGVSNGQPWSGRFRFTRVWVLREGAWLMVASHSSRIEPKL